MPTLPVVPYSAPPLLARLIPDLFLSDHASFWARGYPALMLTDTAPLRNPHYHQPTDTVETLDVVTLDEEIIWDYPKDFFASADAATNPYPYEIDVSAISA